MIVVLHIGVRIHVYVIPLRERKTEREEVKKKQNIWKNVIVEISKRKYSTMCASDQLTQNSFQPPLGETVLILWVLKQVNSS